MNAASLPWYVARAAGLVAWGLLSASVLWGLAMSTRLLRGKIKNSWLLDLHRFLGGLATIFVGVHVLGILADTKIHFGLSQVLVPFASIWRPTAVAWGIAGMYLLLAVELTSLARTKLPTKLWRSLHFLSFPLFFAATLHAITAGTDAHSWMVEGVILAVIAVVTGLSALRVTSDYEGGRPAGPAGRSGRPIADRAGRPAARLQPARVEA
jgi:DMSO/TMAO reductase YedYZ heme-binding membrane subunit